MKKNYRVWSLLLDSAGGAEFLSIPRVECQMGGEGVGVVGDKNISPERGWSLVSVSKCDNGVFIYTAGGVPDGWRGGWSGW